MKKKSLFLSSSLFLLAVSSLSGCASNTLSTNIVIWVGSESVEYYEALGKQFLEENPDFGYTFTITGTDIGSAGGKMEADNTACGDIVSIAHDNIGKLSQKSYIAPIVDQEKSHALYQQIMDDNPQSFIKAIENYYGPTDKENVYTFAVPYISQALFLYYDTRYVSETQAQSFEGLIEAAQAVSSDTKSFTVTGTSGYNYSFPILARNITAGNTSTLRLYEGGERTDAYVQSNEQIAILKYMQRNYQHPNGGTFDSPAKWAVKISSHVALSVIGGAWNFNAFKAAVTDENGVAHMGCAPIPQFTLTAEDVAGINQVNYPNDPGLPEELRGKVDPAPVAGTVMRGGSFVDCKCFVLNMAKIGNAERYYKMCEILKYFSTKQAQNGSYLQAYNVPAYEGADQYVEQTKDEIPDKNVYLMAKAQTSMTPYGIPQPFISGMLNQFYYSSGAPDLYNNCVFNKGGTFSSVDAIRKQLYIIEYIWKNGKNPSASSPQFPTSFPADSTTRF